MKQQTRDSSLNNDQIKQLDWAEMLNEEAIWHDYDDFKTWFCKTAVDVEIPSRVEYEEFRRDLRFIRNQASFIYFDKTPDLDEINDRLSTVVLTIDPDFLLVQPHASPLEKDERLHRFPIVVAKGGGLLKRLFGVFLVEFAQFAARYLASGGPGLCRCEGVFRDARASEMNVPDFEERYREEIDLLKEQDLVHDQTIQRCGDFFIGRPKARFCSDTCRFTTFQIEKKIRDPGYLAEKQRRYRNKHKS